MGGCIYCGQSAGFLRKKHTGCQQKYEEGKKKIVEFSTAIAMPAAMIDSLADQITQTATSSYVGETERKELIVKGFQQAVEKSLDEALLTDEYEQHLEGVLKKLFLTREDLMKDETTFMKMVQSFALHDIIEGIIPPRVFKVEGRLPINLQKNEVVVWAFQDSEYYEDRTRRQYVGRSHGVSARIAKGVYYRVSAFKGMPVDVWERKHVDSGIVVLTTKHIYFVGPRKSLRVPYSKIVSFQPFSDGVGVIRDALSAKPQIFCTKYGWFTYNIVTNLAERARG